MPQATVRKDFFISYTHADRTWAEWIAFQLEEAGYTTILQAWDFRPGSNFVLEMDTAARIAKRTVAVLSPDYFQSGFTPSEWATAFQRDPKGEQHLLVPIRVQPCDVEGLLGSVIYIDLVSLEEQGARTALIEGVSQERAKPSSVAFPREARVPTIPPAFPSTLPSVWTVPYRRNPYFTGREGELVFLANWLSTGGTLALTQSLSGLGGIGKTQLAVEYAYRFRDHYSAVLWVSADSRETLIADCTRLAAELKLPEQEDRDQNKMVPAIQCWLREQQDWLLILDNVEDLGLVTWFLPVQHQGAVLLTTRRQVTEPIAQTIAMDVLPEEEGALFLLRRTKSLPLDGSLDKATETNRQTAHIIARTLGGLPLALDQAGAYILETGCDLATYLVLYKERQTKLLRRRGNVPSDHPLSVMTTFTLAFEEVRPRNEAAIELLRLCAFLAPDAIAEEIIIEGATYLGPALQPVVAEAYALNEIIEVLRTFSLIKRDPVENLLNIHRLVQAVLQDALEEAERRSWAERAIRAVNAAFPHVKPHAWPQCERLLTQALAATQVIERYQLISEEAGRLLYETATYLLERGARYAEAELLYQRALAIREQQLGVGHPLVATSLNSLAILYKEQGKYAEAEPLLQRALHIRLQAWGPEHAETAETMHDLGRLWESQGNSEEARAWYSRTMAVQEQVLGAHHPKTIETRKRFIALLHAIGQHEEVAQFECSQPEERKNEEERKVHQEE